MRDDEPFQPGLICWSCNEKLRLKDLLKEGIIRARIEREGGPYRLLMCPACQRLNLCEKTRRGRWFSSPTVKPTLMDYIVGKLFVGQAEDFLRAMSWYEEHEDRRRYFFERDGDRRYSTGLLRRLFPSARSARREEASEEKDRERAGRRDRGPPPRDEPRPSRPRPRVASPWKILGLEHGASDVEIRRAFHRMAVQYHPDKVHHLGEEFQVMATQKFKELQRAYEALLRRNAE